MKTGHIKIFIDKKIYFEYYLLEKPKWLDYNKIGIQPKYRKNYKFKKGTYDKAMKKYEASKQLIEINNVMVIDCFNLDNNDLDSFWIIIKNKKNIVQNNQPCKAEIKDNKATIIKLL